MKSDHPRRRPTASRSVLNTQYSVLPKGPELLKEVLSRLFAARGWGRKQDRLQLEEAWVEAAGPAFAKHTSIGGLRRGVLEVVVGNGVLLQELAHYHKRRLLEELRRRLPGKTFTDLRFRAGVVKREDC